MEAYTPVKAHDKHRNIQTYANAGAEGQIAQEVSRIQHSAGPLCIALEQPNITAVKE